MIRAGSKLNVREFCADMLGTMFSTAGVGVSSGLLVWGDSWLIQSWEMTEGFVRNWGWLVEGCAELMSATNRWRRERGGEWN
ncbi:hypothetical protein F5884DRAFT_808632 [Xylogone sp. PMI_703]|nr:hypothetical protein F5884DRAFT_808632 [Xylogone sp. PMI_703]